MRRVRCLAGLLAGAAVLAGACGGSDDATSEDALKERVKASAEAIFQGEARDAYEVYSEECRDDVPFFEFRSSLNIATAFVEGFSGQKLEDLEVAEVKVRNFEDDSAEVAIRVRAKDEDDDAESPFGDEDDYTRWEVEDGKWVIGDCSDMTFGGDGAVGDDDDADSDGEPAPTRVARTPTAVPTSATRPKIGEGTLVEDARYIVNAIRDNLEGDEFSEPPPGKRWLAVDVTIEAAGDVSYGSFDFSLQDKDLFVYEPEFVFADEPSPRLSTGELGPGEAVRGWVFFEVPAAAELREVRVSPGFSSRATVIADLTQQ